MTARLSQPARLTTESRRAQYGLLYVCLLYRPAEWFTSRPRRLANFWQWPQFGAYLEFTAIFIVIHSALFLLLHSWDFYVQLLGFIALGVEATVRNAYNQGAGGSLTSGRHAAAYPATHRQLRSKVDCRLPHVGPRRLGVRRHVQAPLLPLHCVLRLLRLDADRND